MKATYSFWVIIILTILTRSIATGQSQRPIYRHSSKLYMDRYVDRLDVGEKVEKGWYHYVGTKTADKKYLLRIFHPDTRQMVALEQYKSNKYLKKKGIAKHWFENGNLKSEGAYKKNKRTGQWKFYNYEDGSLSSVGMYKSDSKIGQWTFYHGKQKVSAYTYNNDIKEGPFIEYNTKGERINQGTYKNDVLYSQVQQVTNNDTISIKQMPLFNSVTCNEITEYAERKICADHMMLTYIYEKIRYPVIARDHYIQGNVVAHFMVNELGLIEDLTFEQALCNEIELECTKVITGMPKWIPGTTNGKPTATKYTLPLKFAVDYNY